SYQDNLPGDVDVLTRVFYDRFGEDGHYLTEVDTPLPQLVLNQDRFRGEWWGSEVKASKTFSDRHTLTLGSEVRDNFRQDLINFTDRPRPVYLEDRRDSFVWGVYAEAELPLRSDLPFHAGVRYDYSDISRDQVSPRVALLYSPVSATTFKLLYGRAF